MDRCPTYAQVRSDLEFHRLKRLDREALAVEELPEGVVEALGRAEVPEEHAHLDEELR